MAQQAFVDSVKSFSDYKRIMSAARKSELKIDEHQKEEVHEKVCKKFEILILVNLGGLLYCRIKTIDRDSKQEQDF